MLAGLHPRSLSRALLIERQPALLRQPSTAG